jgi:hypothetical protein
MKITKQFALVALLVLGATLFANTSARAAEDWGSINLWTGTDANDPDYGASGTATLTNVTSQGFGLVGYTYGEIFVGELSVTYHGLTPGATYRIGPVSPDSRTNLGPGNKFNKYDEPKYVEFRASANGTGVVSTAVGFVIAWDFDPLTGWYLAGWDGYVFSVVRKQGSHSTGVLAGFFQDPYP